MNLASRAQGAHQTQPMPRLAATLVALAATAALPRVADACACGCGIFDVGTGSMYASHAGSMVFAEYDFMDQDRNWSGSSAAPAANNEDKRVRTEFYTVGAQHFFNRRWGASVELPYWRRAFTTTDPDTGDTTSVIHGAAGDVRLKATYTGLSEDMSIGLVAGLKLATGEFNYAGFDADTQIGTGSTDLLLGAYRLGHLDAQQAWSWFAQVQFDVPVAHKAEYRPGAEGVLAGGVYYGGWQLGEGARLAPVGQLRLVHRLADSGSAAFPDDTGYTRLLASPGLELTAGSWKVYADAAFPLVTQVRGNQLVANPLWKLNVSYHF